MEFITIKLEQIKIGDRFRKDFTDVSILAKSIKEIGLMHPIVINQNNQLMVYDPNQPCLSYPRAAVGYPFQKSFINAIVVDPRQNISGMTN